MSQYQLRLLGSFQLFNEAGQSVGFRSEKERALLAYLAVESSRPHSRETLAGLLWPELPSESAHNNLRVTLHRLRQGLGDPDASQPLLEVSREAIQLIQTEELWIDVQAFEGLLSKAEQHTHEKLSSCQECMDKYSEAVAIYQGEFLQGIYPADSLPFSEWALLKREHLHSQVLKALHLLSAYHHRRGELDPALGYARRQLELEPWREEAHGQAMTILALRGERSAALHQYEHCRQVLWEELGVEPAEETRALYERILASRKRRRHNLTRQSTPFIGRKAELNQVSEYLANPDCRLLTVLGPGGIGKSRLAFRVAETQIYNNLQGVTWVQLAGITTLGDMLRAIAEALGLQFRPGGEPEAQLLDYLREKEMLLVLDNYEQLLASGQPSSVAGILIELLENAPDLRILVSSRQRLNLSREQVYVLEGLSYPVDVSNTDVEKYDAVQLFLHSARRTDPGFQPVKGDQLSVVHICQRLEGVPLAIELAAAWTRVMSPMQIAQEIESDLDFLASSYPDLPERHRSLRATFEHSYNLLTPEEQQALCRLSIFPTSFDRSAAEQIAGASLAVLTSLSDRSFLAYDRIKNRGPRLRYRMHELIKQFSHEKFAQDLAEVERTKDQHRSFYMSFLRSRNNDVMGGRASYQAVQAVRGEIENVRVALEQAIAGGNFNELGRSLNILMFFYEIQGLFVEAESVFAKISQRMEEIIHSDKAAEEAGYYLRRAVMYHGWYCMHLGRSDQAVELTRKGLTLSRQSGDMEGYSMALNSLGVFAMEQGKYQRARSYLQEALEINSENGYTWAKAGALGNLGILALMEGDLSRASDLFHQELDLFTQLEDEWGMAGSFDFLGDLALQQGYLELAEKRFRQCLEIRQKLGQRWRVALSLNRLAEVAYRCQQYAEAKKYYQESITILRDFGERLRLTSILASYGEVCTILGENDHARESLHSSIRLAQEIGADGIAARAMLGIAALLAKEGERERSVEILAAIDEHPSLEYEDKKKVANLLNELQGSLPSPVYQTALETGKTKAIEDLVNVIIIN